MPNFRHFTVKQESVICLNQASKPEQPEIHFKHHILSKEQNAGDRLNERLQDSMTNEKSLSSIHCDLFLQSHAKASNLFSVDEQPLLKKSLKQARLIDEEEFGKNSIFRDLKDELEQTKRLHLSVASYLPSKQQNLNLQGNTQVLSSSDSAKIQDDSEVNESHEWNHLFNRESNPTLSSTVSQTDFKISSSKTFSLIDLENLKQDQIAYANSKLLLRNKWNKYMSEEYQKINADNRREVIATRISIKKAVNVSINQLASTKTQIEKVSNKIESIIVGSSSNEEARYRTALLINSILDNAETQLVANPKFVWAFGGLLQRLSFSIKHFRLTFESAIISRCVFVIPSELESVENENNFYSKNIAFCQKMTAYVRLWLAFIALIQDRETFWKWYACFLSLKPQAIFCYLLTGALEVSGFIGLSLFPHQFRKVISFIITTFYPELQTLEKQDTTGSLIGVLTQLKILIEEYNKHGTLPTPLGYQMKHRATHIDPNI